MQKPARTLNIVAEYQCKSTAAGKEGFEIFRNKDEVKGRSIE
jgi:hypothetical protein